MFLFPFFAPSKRKERALKHPEYENITIFSMPIRQNRSIFEGVSIAQLFIKKKEEEEEFIMITN